MALFGRTKDPQQLLQEALMAGDHVKAIPIYEGMLKSDPKNDQLRLRYADSLAAAGKRQNAVAQYMDVAQHMAKGGFLIKSIAVYKKMVALDPSREEFHRELAEMNRAREEGFDYKTAEERAKAPPKEEPAAPEPEPAAEEAAAPEAEAQGEVEAPVPSESEGVPVAEAPEVSEVQDSAPEPVDDFPIEEPDAGLPEELQAPEPEGISFPLTPEPAAEEPAAPAQATDAADIGDADLGDELDDFLDQAVRTATPDEAAEPPTEAPSRSGRTSAPEIPKIPLFSDFSIDEFVEIVAALRHFYYPAGDVLVKEGDPGDSLFVIVQGEVAVSTLAPTGKEVQLATLGEGEFFGEVSLLSGKPRTATITAITETEVMELTKEDFEPIAEKYPDIRNTLHSFWKQRTDQTVETMITAMKED